MEKICGRYDWVLENHQESYYLQEPKNSVLEQFNNDQKLVVSQVSLPLNNSKCSANIFQKIPDDLSEDQKVEVVEPVPVSMQWRTNVGVSGGKYFFEIKIIDTPSIVMLGWTPLSAKIFHETVFSFGTGENCFMLDCSAGVLWQNGCSQGKIAPSAQVGDIYGSELDYDNKIISFYHIRNGRRTDAGKQFDTSSFPAIRNIQTLFPSVGVYSGEVEFIGKPMQTSEKSKDFKPIAEGFENKINLVLSYSTNTPKPQTLEYYIASLEWMQKTYVKYFDGYALPYGPEAYQHMTAPFFSIFPLSVFDETPPLDEFNESPRLLWTLFFRAFLFPILLEGFDAYTKARQLAYNRAMKKHNGGFETALDEIRPRTEEEINVESAIKATFLYIYSQDYEDCKSNGLYRQNEAEIPELFAKCKLDPFDVNSISDENEGRLAYSIESAILQLWDKLVTIYNKSKMDSEIPNEPNLESKLTETQLPIVNSAADINTRIKCIWEAYICYCFPREDFPIQNKTFKEFVGDAKKTLAYYLEKTQKPKVEESNFRTPKKEKIHGENAKPGTTGTTGTTATTTTTTTTIATKETKVTIPDSTNITEVTKEIEQSNNLFLLGGLALGAVAIGAYFFVSQKNNKF